MSRAPFPATPIGMPSPTIVGPAGAQFICLVGSVNLFQFIVPPQPGTVIGTLHTGLISINLVQSNPAAASGVPLASVDRQVATLCGDLRLAQGQPTLDVRFAAAGFSPTTPGLHPLQLWRLLGGRR